MDEILINEKKYISSKQAAKLTGYAKDYIGQLCREGRVPARLVGRSWYVLEAAIQDHRFGVPESAQKAKNISKKVVPSLNWTAEAPRYQADPVDLLPPVRRHSTNEREEKLHEIESSDNLQNSWKAWFDRVGNAITSVEGSESSDEAKNESQEPITDSVMQEITQDAEVNIPIQTIIYRTPPEEIMPHYAPTQPIELEINHKKEPVPIRRGKGRGNTGRMTMIRLFAVILGLSIALMAAINSGYADTFIISKSYSSQLTGIEVYNK